MRNALWIGLLLAPTVWAQTTPAPEGVDPAAEAAEPTVPAPTGAEEPAATPAAAEAAESTEAAVERARKQMREELERAKQQMREEMRAQLATQSLDDEWEDEWSGEDRRKLELFTLDGYFRVRPELFHKYHLNQRPDPAGYTLFPSSPTSDELVEGTQAGVNMRVRMEPTINVSEQIRIRMQIDALDNMVFGSTPDYGFSRTAMGNFSILGDGQTAPRSGVNALQDSITVKRAYGEVSTPFGLLRFGRMGSHWGLGMLRNDGNCLDCDWGDTVDRIQFVTEPLAGWYVSPMIDFDFEGPTSARGFGGGNLAGGQPFDLSQLDDSHSLILAIARRDTEAQARAILDEGGTVFNGGLYLIYKTQSHELDPDVTLAGINGGMAQALRGQYVRRNADTYVADAWFKMERRELRIEAELAVRFGNIGNRASRLANVDDPALNQSLGLFQVGGVLQGEYRLLEDKLRLGLEVGFASGDPAPGFGVRQERAGSGAAGTTREGDIDGPQFDCNPVAGAAAGTCADASIDNFIFNPDYRIDTILWREIVGTVTDAVYVRPTLSYRLSDGLDLTASVIYSRAMFAESTPSGDDPNLGLEIDAGLLYRTEDGFVAGLSWALLFPLEGLKTVTSGDAALESAQGIRSFVGITF